MSQIHPKTLEILIKIGSNVLKYRYEKNLTQEDLAFLCDTDRSFICKIETCKFEGITIGTLAKLSTALEVDIRDLME